VREWAEVHDFLLKGVIMLFAVIYFRTQYELDVVEVEAEDAVHAAAAFINWEADPASIFMVAEGDPRTLLKNCQEVHDHYNKKQYMDLLDSESAWEAGEFVPGPVGDFDDVPF
jgi:hypothetical protein